MTVRYVSNWPFVFAVYLGILSQTSVRFRDGQLVMLSRTNYDSFYEAIYQRHNTSKGFSYEHDNYGNLMVKLPNQLRLHLPSNKPYSFMLDEVFIMKVYGEPSLEGRYVVDIGAAIGDSSLHFAKLGAEVFAYEPNPEYYELAVENVKLNGVENKVHLFNFAVEGGTGPNSLSTILSQKSLVNAFVKVDCEGCEYRILLESNDSMFKRISELVMEVHGNSDKIVQRLRNLGYKVRKRKEILTASRTDR